MDILGIVRKINRWLIPSALAQYRLCMQTIGCGSSGSAWVGVGMHGEVVGSPVGKIKWGDGGFASNGRSHVYSLNIACACKQLAVVVEVVCRLRLICT
jgi:hypothetical protein